MEKKIVFLDVDGTLKNPEKDMSSRIEEAIRQLKENGHYVFVCTGRNKAGVESLRYLNFDGYICSAGGYIEVNGKKIFETYMHEEDVKEVRSIFEKYHIFYNLEALDRTFQDEQMHIEMMKDHKDMEQMNSEMKRMIQEFHVLPIEEYDQHPVPIQKLCFVSKNEDNINQAKKLLEKKFQFVIHDLFSPDTINGEIIPKDKNKGLAVKKVVEYLHMSIEDTIGFGDSMNDYEMIKTCHYGVAMGNASKELKQYADAICESIDDDGVYHELKRLKLI